MHKTMCDYRYYTEILRLGALRRDRLHRCSGKLRRKSKTLYNFPRLHIILYLGERTRRGQADVVYVYTIILTSLIH